MFMVSVLCTSRTCCTSMNLLATETLFRGHAVGFTPVRTRFPMRLKARAADDVQQDHANNSLAMLQIS